MDIRGNGRMLVALDTAGAALGVWQAAGMNGIAVYNEPGGLTREDARLADPDAGWAFYREVFGYHYAGIEGAPPDYRTFDIGGDPLGGIGGMMGAPDGTPSHWVAYFAVADPDTAAATVVAEGGSVVDEPVDSPYGRLATVADPAGAIFVVIGPPTAA